MTRSRSNSEQPRILIWDIEASNLSANFGFILCIGWKWLGEKRKPRIISIRDFSLYKKDPTNDKEVVKAFGEVFAEADMHVAHFGKYFDTPYVNTRRLAHGLPALPQTRLIDTWKLAKVHLKLNSNRLDTIAKFLELKDQKTAVTGPHWVKAMAGNLKALRYVERHCELDVLVLEDVYQALRQFQPEFPRYVGDDRRCPHCHKKKLQKRGFSWAQSRKYQRFQCQACGLWSRASRHERSA